MEAFDRRVPIEVTWGDATLDEGFTPVPNLFLEHAGLLLGLDYKDQLIIIHLMSFMRHGTLTAWPSMRTLEEHSRIPMRTLKRRLGSLKRRGLITVTQRVNEYGRTSNLYNLNPMKTLIERLVKPRRKRNARNGPNPRVKVAPEVNVLKKSKKESSGRPIQEATPEDLEEARRLGESVYLPEKILGRKV